MSRDRYIGRCEVCHRWLHHEERTWSRVTTIGDVKRWHLACDINHPINQKEAS